MIKDVFILKKNSFHVRVMKYIWNLDYHDFSHMCPYWWLSVFNFIVIVPWFVIKETFKFIGYLFRRLGSFLSSVFEMLDEWMEEQAEIRHQKEVEYYIANKDKIKTISEKKYWKIVKSLSWEKGKIIDEVYEEEKRAKRRAKEEREELERMEELKRKFDKLAFKLPLE